MLIIGRNKMFEKKNVLFTVSNIDLTAILIYKILTSSYL